MAAWTQAGQELVFNFNLYESPSDKSGGIPYGGKIGILMEGYEIANFYNAYSFISKMLQI